MFEGEGLPDGADEPNGECAQHGGDRAEEEQRPVVAAPAGRQERGGGDRDEGPGQGVADVEDAHVLGRLVGVGQHRGGERRVDGEVEALAEEFAAVMDGVQLQWVLDPTGVDMAARMRAYLERLLRSITVSGAGLPSDAHTGLTCSHAGTDSDARTD
ncbi:TetR family transcriptional regulator C-terminal domain-containing protein [Streptomyces sp. NPDC127044]